ncbi:hypothetical protein D6D13_01803 [Aureobasidium pullulans]|uniref:NADH-ubiquinone oxidoreductase 299 kDa subunit n=1 Tax=Aureobasidium pullulans TaxID=5580 RepID=A0A4S9D7F3_AURPU|nr:hypothetical protein D6D13_01803 [Aureobasidium pullulans]
MRPSTRLLAQATRYLTPGAPTGLTGVLTHAAPRSTLLYLYNTTLDKLKQFPEHSVYRQSVEALTKHRLSIVESVKPEGLEEWQSRVRSVVEAHPNAFRSIASATNKNEVNIVYNETALKGMETEDYEDEPIQKQEPEGPRVASEKSHQGHSFMADPQADSEMIPRIEPEPPLTSEQINTIESQIEAGLIEEIILVAEAETALVDEMYKSKVWEDLEESPNQGQWAYYERDTHTPKTQAP